MMGTMEAKAFPTDSSRMFSDGLLTQTTAEQQEVEKLVENERQKIRADSTSSLCRQQHIGYILNGLQHLSHSCMSMDSSRAWFCFWGVHSLNLLEARPEKELAKRIVTFLRTCRTPEGGYAGAPSQLAHLATTYASIMTLASIGTEEALASIDRAALWNFLASMRQQNGSFFIHRGGETDVRAAYCALAVAHLCRLPALDELFQGTATWLTRCQTYEGGFGGEPNCEAHGGYTFCALAGLALLQKIHLVNVEMAQRWLANRQMIFEGGFQGRTNKLVDVCYSYWQSASFSALESQQQQQIGGKQHHNLFNTAALQSYILDVCQEKNSGGFRDKPEKHTDLYHTCYALSGLSIAQSYARKEGNILGGEAVTLEPIHPLFNITLSAYERAFAYFDSADIDPQK